MGQYQAALESYNQALAIVRDKQRYFYDATNAEGTILNNIGSVYEQLGQYQAALDSYKQALAIVRESSGRQTTLINIGSVSEKMGQHQAALESYEQALAIASGVKDRPTEGVILLHKGKVYQKIGQHQTALESYQEALTILREVGNRPGEGQALNNIGEAHYNLGQHQTALEYYQQALAIREEVSDKAGTGVTFNNIGATLEAQKQPELAIIFYKQSVNIKEAIRKDIRGLSKEQQQSFTETVADSYRRLADLLLQQNRVLEAQRVLDLLKVQELDDYLRNVRGNDQTALGVENLPPEQQFIEKYNEVQNQAILLGKELAQLRQIPEAQQTPAQQQRIAELVAKQGQIKRSFVEFTKRPDVVALVQQLNQTTKEQNLQLGKLTNISDNLRNLKQNAVLLYPLILENRIELILTTPDSPPIRRTVPVKRAELNKAIINFRQALIVPSRDAVAPARQLYDWLIKPLENDLNAAQAKTIIYAPDGQLRYIPLAALHDGKGWLVQRFRVNNITADSLTDFNTKPQQQLRVLAGAFTQGSYDFSVGDRQFSFSGLPFAGREVETLAAGVPGTTKLIDKDFSKQATIPRLDNHSVVHFATHAALVQGKPDESFILFGNGDRVSMREVENTWRMTNVDLIVLSACETGLGNQLGNGEEILGFGYLMQSAGARAAIASLWKVDDGGTQALMSAFYEAMKGDNITKAEALRQAQIALITGDYTALGKQRGLEVQQQINSNLPSAVSRRLSHPYYWAPFILIGNGL